MCNFPNCKKQPLFNMKGEKQAIFCNAHKLEHMIDVKPVLKMDVKNERVIIQKGNPLEYIVIYIKKKE